MHYFITNITNYKKEIIHVSDPYLLRVLLLLLSLRLGHFLNTEKDIPSKKPMITDNISHHLSEQIRISKFYHRWRGASRRQRAP